MVEGVMDQGLTFVHFPCRWIAPEIFEPAGDYDIVQEESSFEDRSRPSLKMTGEPPYSYIRYDTAVITVLGRGDLLDGLWSLLEGCWNRVPQRGLTAEMPSSWFNILRSTTTF